MSLQTQKLPFDLITLRDVLLEVDCDLYHCTVCASALAANKKLTLDDQDQLLISARRFHGLARLLRDDL
jgi:hypothetical protein